MVTTRLQLSTIAMSAVLALAAPAAMAHDLWVNAMSATTDGHGTKDGLRSVVVTSIGWGHTPLPLSEFMPGSRIAAYQLIGPDGRKLALPFDKAANAKVAHALDNAPGLTLQAGDALMRRMILGAEAPQGGWRVHVANPPGVRTVWIDAEGRSQSGAQFVDEIKGAKKIVTTALTVRDASAWWRHGAWSKPAPAGAALELLPMSDPTGLRAGDSLEVALMWKGRPLDGARLALFTAFGESKQEAKIDEKGAGRAVFTLPSAGVWVLRAELTTPVAEAGAEYAKFAKRIDNIRFVSTMAIKAAP